MTQSSSQDADVLALRRAGEAGDWNACLDATKRLLLRIPAQQAVVLTRNHVAARLPGFENHQPGVTWPREFIEATDKAGTTASRDWPENDEFSGPGANNFISAVRHLWEASRIADDDEERVRALVRAIANAIMAEKLENWGARNLEQWRRWYAQPSEGNERLEQLRLQEQAVLGPEGTRIGRRAWLEVAEQLEKALE